jgi:SPP1 family predicted phage head-tail adaptor
MRIGELRKRVTVQAEQATTDNAGGYGLGWTDVATVWAEIKPVSGNKIYTAQHLEGHVTHEITMRWQSGTAITTDMRILYGARLFNIRAVENTGERNQFLEILAEEGTAL